MVEKTNILQKDTNEIVLIAVRNIFRSFLKFRKLNSARAWASSLE